MIWTRLALRSGLIIAYCSVLSLIVLSVIEVFKAIADIIRELEKANEILLLGALAVALLPSVAMLFWVCKAIAVELYLPIERVRRYFRTQGKA